MKSKKRFHVKKTREFIEEWFKARVWKKAREKMKKKSARFRLSNGLFKVR